MDFDRMLAKVRSSQWTLAEIDWNLPGADSVTMEQWPHLKHFFADMIWLEHVGARLFALMAKKAPTDTLREMYTCFGVEERRHGDAEILLMKRWGMTENNNLLPDPNISLRLMIAWLELCGDAMPFYVLCSVTPLLESCLDVCFVKLLGETVKDPVCHMVFERINGDESRHLAVGYTVLEMQGSNKTLVQLMRMTKPLLDPRLALGIAVYAPLVNRCMDRYFELGGSEEDVRLAVKTFQRVAGRTACGRRNSWFQIVGVHARCIANRNNKLYHIPVDTALKLARHLPKWAVPLPVWAQAMLSPSTPAHIPPTLTPGCAS